jgi:hypothetical protein
MRGLLGKESSVTEGGWVDDTCLFAGMEDLCEILPENEFLDRDVQSYNARKLSLGSVERYTPEYRVESWHACMQFIYNPLQ